MSEVNHFKELAKINVNGKTEQKGKFTYLSWAFAVEELMKADPMANWEIHEPKYYGQQVMVSCTVTAFNKPIYMWLPVMDFKNQAMNNPDVMAINKTIMRCLVKAIACHGIGLYIYAGEDLPSDDDVSYQNLQQAPVANAAMQQGGQIGAVKQKPSIDDVAFQRAIANIKTGGKDKNNVPITRKYIEDRFTLTLDQQAELASMVA